MKYIIIPFFLITTMASANDPKTIYSSDLNKDGKVDFVEIFKNEILVERKEDLDFDGVFDRQTLFTPEAPEKYIKVVTERKGNVRTRKSFWNDQKLQRTFALTQIDKNDDGTFDEEFQNSTPLNSHKEDDCDEKTEYLELANDAVKAAHQSDEYKLTSWGQKVHTSCIDKDGWFLKHAESSILEGMACLKNLGNQGGKGAAKNAASVENLMNQKSVQVICNENSYNWGNSTIAHATTSSDVGKTVLKHPGISFNPKKLKEGMSDSKNGVLEFKRTLFHEQLHNLGYLHGHDVEYSYTCEVCCFPSQNDSNEAKDSACKVCAGNYSDTMDPAYLKDITAYGEATFSRSQALSTSLKFAKVNFKDMTGLSYVAANMSGYFDPVGPQLASLIKANGRPDPSLTPLLNRAEKYKNDPLHKTYETSSKIVAEALYTSYAVQDPAQALKLLKENAALIKTELKKPNTEKNSEYVRASIQDSIKRLVFDVWLDKHHGNTKDDALKKKLNSEAYDVAMMFGL